MTPLKQKKIGIPLAISFPLFILGIAFLLGPLSCTKRQYSYSLLRDQETFFQKTTEVHNYVDILWVIDNSATMKSSQDNLVENFEAFITKFLELDLDFRMAVTTTDSWQDFYDHDLNLSQFKDGTADTAYSGYPILTPFTPNLAESFAINILQGTGGLGNERAFQSIQTALTNPNNTGFLREGVHLAIIIVSDEDDFSRTSPEWEEAYDLPDLWSINQFSQKLDTLTGSAPRRRRYDVSTISILDPECLNALSQADLYKGRKITRRYREMALLTGGIVASLCDSFSDRLEFLSNSIIQKATLHPLSREPIPASIEVMVNGQIIPRTSPDKSELGGWDYMPEAQALKFSEPYIPANGSKIQVSFDPAQFD